MSSSSGMRIELTDGEVLELSDREAQTLYETLLERARTRGATSAARKLRPALAWSSGAGTKVALDQFETAAVQSIQEEGRPG
jgi:hypothetical protein